MRAGGAVLLALLAAGCGAPDSLSVASLSVTHYQPPLTGRPSPTIAPKGPAMARAEGNLLRDGWINAGLERMPLDRLPPWDEAARRCPDAAPLCRLAPAQPGEPDRVLVDRGPRRPWLLLLPPGGPPDGVFDLLDEGNSVMVVWR